MRDTENWKYMKHREKGINGNKKMSDFLENRQHLKLRGQRAI